MLMARRVEAHLRKMGSRFSVVEHPHSYSSLESAHSAHIPPEKVAKAVMVHDGDCYRMCVIPANHRLVLAWLDAHMHGSFRLVEEDELRFLFDDCEPGAVPALGQVYGIPVVWDESFREMQDVYLEGGDHRHLIHLDHGAFLELLGRQEHLVISAPADNHFDWMIH